MASADSGNSGRGGNSRGGNAKGRRGKYSNRKKDGDKFMEVKHYDDIMDIFA